MVSGIEKCKLIGLVSIPLIQLHYSLLFKDDGVHRLNPGSAE